MTAPIRLRLSRARGFDLQAASRAANGLPAVNVARSGPYGNCFRIGMDGDAAYCVELHRNLLGGLLCLSSSVPTADQEATRSHVRVAFEQGRHRGSNVACWCRIGAPCHGDTLLAVFNRRAAESIPA